MSNEFVAKRRKLRVTIDDVQYELAFPKVREIEEFQRTSQGVKEKDALGVLIGFLETLGLKAEAARSLEPDDLQEIVKILTGQKKS